MKKEKYKIKNGASIPVPPDVVAREIKRAVRESGGQNVPEQLVKASQPANAPLHDCFEWSNSKAAHKYRIQQASYLIRSIEIVYVEGDKESIPTRAFVALVNEGTHKARTYMDVGTVLNDKDLRLQYLQQLLDEYIALYERNRSVKEFAAIHREIRAAHKKLRNKR